jgi:hypothetical protein
VASTDHSPNEKPASNEDDKKILEAAHKRFKVTEEAESEIRRLALEDLEFSSGKQWPDKIKADREQDGRPCLVINKIPQFVQQVTNDQRQNRPSIKVHPVDDNADIDTAKIIQGLIRHIEYNSNAEVAYDTAFDSCVRGGFGYWRVITEFSSPISFDQEILIKRIRNPFSVFFDPYTQEPDGSDASFAFVVEDLSEQEYKEKYPNSILSGRDAWTSIGNTAPSWMPKGCARVAEYFYKELQEETICLLSTGESVLKSKLKDQPQKIDEQGNPVEIQVIKDRKTMVPKIRHVKLNGFEILEKTDWAGSYIPIVPVYGAELDINGVRILEGVIRNAKDPARQYNYFASAETEAVALAPRAPFIMAEGQIEGYEAVWAQANRRNNSYLPYKPVALNNVPVPPPQRNAFEPAVQAITNARMMASDDLKATTGIYDAALGNQSRETSGIAIQRRNTQTQTSNFHFVDNLTRSLRHTGRILIDLIPKIYDTPRASRIVADDGEQKVVKLNQPFDDNGKPMLYALDAGKYDVTVDTGPSFQTKRQEATASMLELSKTAPQMMQVAPDLIMKGMDFPGATELADRFKKTIPPNLLDDPKNQQSSVPPQAQQQMTQMGQMIDALTKQLHEAHDVIDNKRVELESRERIEMAKLETTATIELAKLESKESLNMLAHQIAEIDQRTKMLGFNQPFPQDNELNEQNLSPMPNGGNPAAQGMGAQPTGGFTPGTPLEPNP